MEVPAHCLLCEDEDETVAHLFLNCKFSRQVWGEFALRMADAAARIGGRLIRDRDFRVGDLIVSIDKFHPKLECWGLHWLGLAMFMWHICCERNRQFKARERQTAKVVAREMLQDIEMSFEGDLKC